jgi:hypothetical protein
MSKPEDFKFDSRVRERLLRNQVLASAELKQHLEQLPDLEGEYELMNDTPQPAVVPMRSQVEEPLVFDSIRRLQALSSDTHGVGRYGAGAPSQQPNTNVSPLLSPGREPPARPLGTPLRSALMESEISGVGAGAVSAAIGAMAAEARNAAGFGVPAAPPPPVSPAAPAPAHVAPDPETPQTPVTLRSQPHPDGLVDPAASTRTVADWEAPYPDSEDLS